MRDVLKIAVTGGVACGKTAVCRLLYEKFPVGRAMFLSCDEVVKELLETPGVRRSIDAIGKSYQRDLLYAGELDRNALRELLFENSEFRGKVEGVLHPLVLERVNAQLKSLSELVRITIIEVPLLYEVDFPLPRDLDLVVAASESTQMRRLLTHRGLESLVGKRIIKAQVPIEEKIQKADIVVWNDGDMDSLESQANHLIQRCSRLFN